MKGHGDVAADTEKDTARHSVLLVGKTHHLEKKIEPESVQNLRSTTSLWEIEEREKHIH